MSKIATYKISPRELVNLKSSLENVDLIKDSLLVYSGVLKNYGKSLPSSTESLILTFSLRIL